MCQDAAVKLLNCSLQSGVFCSMSRSYFISKESLYIHPACLCVAEDATLTVHSLKLQLCPATAQALVVLALDSAVVFEAAINSTRDPLK